MWTCSLLKTNAKQALRCRYWRCFWICLVLGLVGVGGSSASTGGSRYTMDTVTGSDTAYDRVANYLDSLSYQMLMTILVVAVLAVVISLLWSIFVTAPLEVGRDRYFMESRQALSPAATVTSVFRTPYMNVVKVQFLRNLKIVVGTLLLVVPGIYWSFCYALVPYLLAEPLSVDYPRHAVEQRHHGRRKVPLLCTGAFVYWLEHALLAYAGHRVLLPGTV